jgi:hypothetical protein
MSPNTQAAETVLQRQQLQSACDFGLAAIFAIMVAVVALCCSWCCHCHCRGAGQCRRYSRREATRIALLSCVRSIPLPFADCSLLRQRIHDVGNKVRSGEELGELAEPGRGYESLR